MHVHPTALDPEPYLVLDLSRGLDPHQARCRRCRWRSGWRATAVQARVERWIPLLTPRSSTNC